ncbi:MAG: phosphatase PAP2 family protein [Candidatus Baltobacteraceae bacterium]
MRPLRAFCATVVLLSLVLGPASAKPDAQFHYVDPRRVDLTVLLPPPPDIGSPEQHADEQQVAAAVAADNPVAIAYAQAARKRSVFFFAASIGSGFTAARLPKTAAFFTHVASDVEKLVDIAKAYWERPRPSTAGKAEGSYPSGHAAFAASTAIILAQLIPAKRDAIFTQARLFAENRIILGRHFPSDVAAGWTAGSLAAAAMMQDPTFQHDFAAAQAELRSANL